MHFFFVLLSCSFFVAYIFIKYSFLELGYLSSLLSIILISTFQTLTPANSMLVSIILSQEVTRPEARYKLILYEKSEVDQGDNQVPAYHS